MLETAPYLTAERASTLTPVRCTVEEEVGSLRADRKLAASLEYAWKTKARESVNSCIL